MLLFLLLLNVITSYVFRELYLRKVSTVTQLRKSSIDGKNFYLMAGMNNQPEVGFKFLTEWIPEKDGIYLLRYNNVGFKPDYFSKNLKKNLKKNSVLCAISVGEQVMAEVGGNEIIRVAVNPCVSSSTLKDEIRKKLIVGAPIVMLMVRATGWLAFLPILPADAGRYSLSLLSDQLMAIAFGEICPRECLCQKVILSKEDEFLDNEKIQEIYEGEILWINTKHARTSGEYSSEYLEAFKKILTPS